MHFTGKSVHFDHVLPSVGKSFGASLHDYGDFLHLINAQRET
jgi:hypothetical protein